MFVSSNNSFVRDCPVAGIRGEVPVPPSAAISTPLALRLVGLRFSTFPESNSTSRDGESPAVHDSFSVITHHIAAAVALRSFQRFQFRFLVILCRGRPKRTSLRSDSCFDERFLGLARSLLSRPICSSSDRSKLVRTLSDLHDEPQNRAFQPRS